MQKVSFLYNLNLFSAVKELKNDEDIDVKYFVSKFSI